MTEQSDWKQHHSENMLRWCVRVNAHLHLIDWPMRGVAAANTEPG